MELLHRGKVRDVYVDGDDLILVATDRISTYDVVHPTPVPCKGRLLTALSLWWFEQLQGVVPNHVISATDVPAEYADRAIRCRRLQIVPVEAIVRGYLAGLGWESYRTAGMVSGVKLPEGLLQGSRLPEPVFTATTKTPPEEGHDEPLTFAEVVDVVGEATAVQLRDTSLALYTKAAEIAAARGVLLADTKFELGFTPDGELLVADEVGTPDSSRFWLADLWEPGHRQVGYDKEFFREWARDLGSWDRRPPAPAIPPEVVAEGRARYIEIYERLTGLTWN